MKANCRPHSRIAVESWAARVSWLIDLPRTWEQFKYVLPWLSSLVWRSSALSQRVPWIVYAARHHLETRLLPGSHVFEYGSGGSTLWFADHGCHVVAIEHDREWWGRVREQLAPSQQSHVTLQLIEVEPKKGRGQEHLDPFVSADPNYGGMTFARYVTSIDRFADGTLDAVLVDGRSRPSCLIRAWPKVRAGGVLVLDNSDRARYVAAIDRLPKKGRFEYYGPAICSRWYWRTTIWEKDG